MTFFDYIRLSTYEDLKFSFFLLLLVLWFGSLLVFGHDLCFLRLRDRLSRYYVLWHIVRGLGLVGVSHEILLDLVFRDEVDWNIDELLSSNLVVRPSLFVIFIHKLKVEVMEVERQGELQCGFCKCLTQTDTFATKERIEGQWIAWLSIWSLKILGLRIEALRDEAKWLYPLSRIFVHLLHCNEDWGAFRDCHSLNDYVFAKAGC